MADLQMTEDRTMRLQVVVDGEIHTCSWINVPVSMENKGDGYFTGWYYDEEDIPFFLANTCQGAAYMLRKELGKRTRHPDEDIGDPIGDHHGKKI